MSPHPTVGSVFECKVHTALHGATFCSLHAAFHSWAHVLALDRLESGGSHQRLCAEAAESELKCLRDELDVSRAERLAAETEAAAAAAELALCKRIVAQTETTNSASGIAEGVQAAVAHARAEGEVTTSHLRKELARATDAYAALKDEHAELGRAHAAIVEAHRAMQAELARMGGELAAALERASTDEVSAMVLLSLSSPSRFDL